MAQREMEGAAVLPARTADGGGSAKPSKNHLLHVYPGQQSQRSQKGFHLMMRVTLRYYNSTVILYIVEKCYM